MFPGPLTYPGAVSHLGSASIGPSQCFKEGDDLGDLFLRQIQRLQFTVTGGRFGSGVVMVQYFLQGRELTGMHERSTLGDVAQGRWLVLAFLLMLVNDQEVKFGTLIRLCIAVNAQAVEFICQHLLRTQTATDIIGQVVYAAGTPVL